ncbi:major capsid protein [Caudoviricetes sp.]|nr:major capsid protein [Caudoviricetes sp.]
MSATMTTANGILKEVYEGQINDQLNEEKVLLKRVEESTDGVFETAGGKYVVFPVRNRRNHGISYRDENTQLAAAGRQGYAQAQETLKYGYGRVRLTGQLMSLADSNPKAFANSADLEMEGLRKDIGIDCARIAWGHFQAATVGATGLLARCTAIGTATTTINAPVTSVIEVGMVIDITDNAGTPIASGTGRTVTSAVPGAASFVIDVAVTTAVGNNIVRTGNFNKEPFGLLQLADSVGTVHNINSATAGNEYWRSNVDASTTTLTEAAMIRSCDSIRVAGGARPSAFFCSLGVRRAYFNLMTTLRRYNEPKEFSGGLIGLAFNYEKEIPVVSDIYAPASTGAFVTESELKIYRNKAWHWADDDGSVLKYVHDYDAFEAIFRQYWQIVTHQRNAHSKMTTITEV